MSVLLRSTGILILEFRVTLRPVIARRWFVYWAAVLDLWSYGLLSQSHPLSAAGLVFVSRRGGGGSV